MKEQERKKLILVVDDELDLVETIHEILQIEGYEVKSWPRAAAAIEYLHTNGADLLLVDMMMPEMSGLEVLRHIRGDAHLSGLPVILMSAVRPTVKREEFGWNEFLQKPFSLTRLSEAVHEALASQASKPRAHSPDRGASVL